MFHVWSSRQCFIVMFFVIVVRWEIFCASHQFSSWWHLSNSRNLFSVVASTNESQQSILTTVQQEMAQRRKQKNNGNVLKNGTNGTVTQVPFMTRQDSRLSVKSLIESIENTNKGSSGSHSGSTNSLNSLEHQQIDLVKTPSATDIEKSLNNNSITSNNNLSSNNINGAQKNRGEW